MTTRPYKVEYYGQALSSITVPIDITDSVQSIDKLQYIGTGKLTNASISLKSAYGHHITNNSNNTKPIISSFDFIRITVGTGSDTYSKVFYVDNKDKQDSPNGKLLHLDLLGREALLKEQKIAGIYYEKPIKEMIREIVEQFNEASYLSTLSPQITFQGPTEITDKYLEVPDFPVSTFDWTENGTNMYDALSTCLDRLELSGAAGGVGDLFELVFDDDMDENRNRYLICKIFPQGARNATPPTLNTDDPIEFLANEPNENANIMVVRGSQDAGRMPRQLDVYRSGVEYYELILKNRPWVSTTTYQKDVYVSYSDNVYQSVADGNTGNVPNSSSGWDLKQIHDFVGDIDYSPWTKDKAALWKNGAGNPEGALDTDINSLCFYDGNLVIHDKHHRDWADFVGTDLTAIPGSYKYPDAGNAVPRYYEGMRIFILGDPTGAPFTDNNGRDEFGIEYKDKIAQYSREGRWVVISRAPVLGDQVVITSSGKEYTNRKIVTATTTDGFNIVYTGAVEWREDVGAAYSLNSLHYPVSVENVKGLTSTHIAPSGDDYNENSGLRVTYTVNESIIGLLSEVTTLLAYILSSLALPTIIARLADILTGGSGRIPLLEKTFNEFISGLHNLGWWVSFELPFPKCTLNGITENVGELYGGTTVSKIPFLDSENTRIMYDGNKGFLHESSKSYGELNGITFLFKFDIRYGADELIPDTGDIPFNVFLYDTESNVMRATFNYRFQSETQRIVIPFSDFKIYRARSSPDIGLVTGDTLAGFVDNELYNKDQFLWRSIKRVAIVYDLAYDEKGRYSPYSAEKNLQRIGSAYLGGVVFDGTIDAFGFIKAPISIAETGDAVGISNRRVLMENIIDLPGTDNVIQMDNIAKAELDLANHVKKTFEYKDTGKCDLNVGDSVYVNGPDIINEPSNTVKMVVDNIDYTISPDGGRSGFIRTLHLAKRINA